MSNQSQSYINLLLFSVGGVYFAIDAEQACGMTPYTSEEMDDLFWFHEELGFGARAVTYVTPTVVTIRLPEDRSYRVIIDSLEDIEEFSRHDIRLFPELLEPVALQRGMWGIVVKDDRMILLVDFERLLRERIDATAHGEEPKHEDI